MARDNQDLTKGPLARKILFFSAPLIVSNLLQVLLMWRILPLSGVLRGHQPGISWIDNDSCDDVYEFLMGSEALMF